MNQNPNSDNRAESSEPTSDDTLMQQLMARAGHGATASSEAHARIHAAAQSSWKDMVAHRRVRRRNTWLALATIAAISTTAWVQLGRTPSTSVTSPVPRLASVTLAQGPVYRLRTGEPRVLLQPGQGQSLRKGDSIYTAAGGRVALTLADGLAMRIGDGTLVTFDSLDKATVARGLIYVDTQEPTGDGVSPPFKVVTSFGTIDHLGTQYEASVHHTGLQVRVREGTITIDTGSRRIVEQSGHEITLASSGAVDRAVIETHGPSWMWVEQLTTIEPRDPYPVMDLLHWIARATGRQLQFETPLAKRQTRKLALHGLFGLNPDEALEVIRTTTKLNYTLHDGVLLIHATGTGHARGTPE